jgi:uncharacterized protein (TIGR03435 family)
MSLPNSSTLKLDSQTSVCALAVIGLVCLLSFPCAAQPGKPAQLEFEVASIKPVQQPGKPGPVSGYAGRISGRNVTLYSLIGFAYRVLPGMESVGGPGWIQSAQFEVDAKPGRQATLEELRPMLRALLADRFKLVTHIEDRPTQVYVLEVAKNGSKLEEAAGPEGLVSPTSFAGFVGKSATMERLALWLSMILNEPVIDKTGLKGFYNFRMDIPLDAGAAASAIPGDNERKTSFPNFSAPIMVGLPKYLGLKLTERKLPMPVVVIDRAEKPTEN